VKGLAAPSNLSMNQTLEGHSGKIDQSINGNGLIIDTFSSSYANLQCVYNI
jgi:hypothetical protein